MEKQYYREDIAASKPYRAGYLQSVMDYLQRERERSEAKREEFAPPEALAADPEGYRKKFLAMLGAPLCGYEAYRDTPVGVVEDSFVGTDDTSEIRRMRLDVLDGFTMYGLLFLPLAGVGRTTPFVISQHGGAGTPEVCSDFYHDNNYNHQTMRVTSRGAVVFAPQLLLWNIDAFGDKYDRAGIDIALKQFGSSITALEVFGIRRCLDYFVTRDYCNPDHIGMIGLSYGGFYTFMTAAADTRIRSAYASCSFTDKTENYYMTDWAWFNSGNTFLDAQAAALIAPRALAVDAGDNDPLFGSEGTKREFARAKRYYDAQGAGDRLFLKTFGGDHELCPADDALDFFFAHL